MKVSTVEEMRDLDRRAVSEHGVPEQILMENAGLGAAHVIADELGVEGVRFCVLCGAGNNGGDGLVVARKLASNRGQVRVFVIGDPDGYGASSRLNLEMAAKAGLTVEIGASTAAVEATIRDSDAVVDGLLGTGLKREVGGQYRELIELVNASGLPVFSLDIPSGVDGNTGLVRGVAVAADSTITFGLPKLGNLLYPGAELGGRLYVTHISYPVELQQSANIQTELNLPPELEPRPVDGHKGSFGDVLFVAGAASYYGAPSLAALSMLKAGGGYSRLAAPRSVTRVVAGLAPEVVFVPQEETASGGLPLAAAAGLLELGGQVDMVVVGPGLSLDGETRQLVCRLASELKRPLLIDGDGLTAVADELEVVRRRTALTVLTPHPGEMARLVGRSVAEVQADPVGTVRRAAADLAAVIVLKQARSLIGLPDGTVYLNPSGNSGMATAGSGDVLTGTIAAMFGLGLELGDATRTGVFMHGLAGDLAAEEMGEDGMTARDILDHLPEAVATYREDYDELMEDAYGAVTVIG